MIFRIGTINAVLSSVEETAGVATLGEVDGNERLSKEYVEILHSKTKIGAVDDPKTNADVNEDILPFPEKITPALELRQQIPIPSQALRNPPFPPETTYDGDDRKDASHGPDTLVFDSSKELGMLDGDLIPKEQNAAAGRSLQDACGDDRPLIGADANFQTLVSVCIDSEELCPYSAQLECWDTSEVTDMRQAFQSAWYFNDPIGSWDTSKVTTMNGMFQNAKAFDQKIDAWDVSAVTDMNAMFVGASHFNQPLGSWDISAVKRTRMMFSGAESFDQSIDSWDTSNVENMSYMFQNAESFNQPLDSWDTSAVTAIHLMFQQAKSFNQCLSTWADKSDNLVAVDYMFSNSGCPYQSDPDPKVGPWCQGTDQQCYSSSFSADSSSATSLASSIAFGMMMTSIAMFVFEE